MENNTQCTTISGRKEEMTQCITAKQEVYGKLILVIYYDSSINSDQKQKLLSWSHTGSCLATQRVIAGLQQPARLS